MLKVLGRFIHQSYFVVAMCVGVIGGTILALVFRINYFTSPVWIGFSLLLLVIAYLRPRFTFIIIALVAGMILVFFRCSSELEGEDYIRQFYDQTIVVAGVVSGDPESDEATTKFKLTELEFGKDSEAHQVSGNLYVSLKYTPEIARADTVTLKGKLSSGFGTYAGYFYKPIVVSVKRPEPGDLILRIRNWFSDRVRSLIPEPEVSLGLSYLLGMKSNLDDDLSEKLRIVGLVHIVVASGAHLSILVEIAKKIFGKISRFAGLLFSILFTLFFMAMVGWTPSILRAGVMVILTLIAWYVGRKFAPWRIIILVAAFTLMLNPMFIINLGWLLSFASFGGIMILGPKLTQFFYGEKSPGLISSIILTTISATLMTLPITLYYYGQISLISVIANLLILPTLSYAMGLVFLAGVVTGIPGISTVVGFLATKLLDFHIAVVELFGEMEMFLVRIEPYNPWVFGIYVLIFVPLIVLLLRQKVVKLREVKDNLE